MPRLQPNYEEPADSQLSALQGHPDDAFWNAVVDTLEMICADDDDGVGRAHRVSGPLRSMWAVRIPHRDPDNWFVLWEHDTAPDGTPEAVIYYIGPLPHGLV